MRELVQWFVACVVLGTWACASKTPAAEDGAAQPAASGGEASLQEQTIADHMTLNFLLGIEMRDAIIQGNLPLAQQKASDLGSRDYGKVLPEHWTKDVAKMQDSAREIASAHNLSEASHHLAELAATCGDCHSRLPSRGRDTEQDHGFSAKGPEDIATRMARHERAADGMWFGLTMPSDASWRGGARALTEAPMSAPQVDGQAVDAATDAKMEAVREIGRRALEAEQVTERVKVFGELIGSCTGCHAPGA
jgi:hypothetical protein